MKRPPLVVRPLASNCTYPVAGSMRNPYRNKSLATYRYEPEGSTTVDPWPPPAVVLPAPVLASTAAMAPVAGSIEYAVTSCAVPTNRYLPLGCTVSETGSWSQLTSGNGLPGISVSTPVPASTLNAETVLSSLLAT